MNRICYFSGMVESSQFRIDHAWRYFQLHAEQRMTVFNFFLVLSGLITAGLAATFQGTAPSLLGVVLGFLLAVVAFIFWKLDQRVCFLMKRAERAIASIETTLADGKWQLFLSESEDTKAEQEKGNGWTSLWTYGRSFRVTYWAIGLFGLVGSAVSALRGARTLAC